MTRLVEFVLLLTPLFAYLLWRNLVSRGIPNPSRHTLLALAAALSVLGGSLVALSFSERHSGATRYIPAHLEHGQVIPGHDA